MKIASLIVISALTGAAMVQATYAQAADTAAGEAIVDKATFVAKAASSNQWEILSSQMALDRAKSEDVRAFAQKMIDDHTKAGDKMMATLQKNGDPAPSVQLAAKHQAMLETLKKAEGDGFETAYIGLQKDAHVEAVGLFKGYAKGGDDANLKQFAESTLPNLEMHLDHVKQLGSAHGMTN